MLPAFRAAWGWSSVRKFPAWWVWLWTWKMFFPTPGRWKFPLPVWTDLFFKASQLLPYVGRELDVTLWNPHPAYAPRKKFRGTLVRAGGDDFTLHVDDMPPPLCEADIDMTWDSVRRARLVPVFPDTSKPGKKAAPGVPRGTAAKKSAGGGKKA